MTLEELNRLHERVSPEQRDELLQCLLVAAPRGGEAMIKVLGDELLCHATEELLEEHRDSGRGSAVSDPYQAEGD
jgi:hypothetical protein